jgi:hypothetical protein
MATATSKATRGRSAAQPEEESAPTTRDAFEESVARAVERTVYPILKELLDVRPPAPAVPAGTWFRGITDGHPLSRHSRWHCANGKVTPWRMAAGTRWSHIVFVVGAVCGQSLTVEGDGEFPRVELVQAKAPDETIPTCRSCTAKAERKERAA